MRYFSWALALSITLCVACGGGSSSPTTPAPVDGPPAGVTIVTLTTWDIPNRSAAISWTAVSGATDYDVTAGMTAGGEDVGKLTVNATTATLPSLPQRGTLHVTVTPRNAKGTGTKGTASFYLVDFQAVVETLFLNSGPYSETQFGGTPGFSTMRGWAPGSRVRILLSSEVEDLRPTAEKVAGQLTQITGGVVTAFVESGGDNRWVDPRNAPANTVKVVSTTEMPVNLCGGGRWDCGRADADAEPVRTRVTLLMGPDLLPGNRKVVFAHELGHALLGWAHWGGYFDGRPGANKFACQPYAPQILYPYLVMCGRQEPIRDGVPAAQQDELSSIELEAGRRVYAAGLRAGASRSEFASRGFIQ